MNEDELIRQAAEGNMGSFAQLVQAHRDKVLRTAYGVVGSIQEAEDVAQDVFLKVWNSLDQYRPGSSFGAWLYRITMNAAIDAVRSRPEQSPFDEWQATSGETPEGLAVDRDDQERVRQAIAALPPGSRAALVLREFEGLSYKEIAQALSIPIGTVMSRLNYARQALRERLAEPGH